MKKLQQYLNISKTELRTLLTWAFNSGKNNVSDYYFEKAIDQTINDMNWGY